MKPKSLFPVILALTVAAGTQSCRENNDTETSKQLLLTESEKWWGGAVVDGRNAPYQGDGFIYDQRGDCRGNQSQPFFLSNKGRYIWSEKPLIIKMSDGKISVKTDGAEIITGKAGETLRDVFLYSGKRFFPPSGKTPDTLLFTNPQYNTWIELQYDQNEEDILKYAGDIIKNGFPAGVLMIDDNWQERYGTWEFNCEKFRDPKGMIDKLHNMDFKVMLWICPFISSDSPVYRELAERRLLIFRDTAKTRPAIVEWWNGSSAIIDLSNPDGVKWFKDQLNSLVREYGVDGFKLDAGDPEYYTGTYSFGDYNPNEQCEAFAKIGLDYPMNEYRACWKMAGEPLGQRLRDKSHTWNDLRVLIPDMINLGLLGYQFGCPDLIGGGEYTSFQDSSIMDEELIVRSSQIHALMGMMQFSVAPWRVLSSENLSVCREMALLHLKMGGEIISLAKECAVSGEPMVRNLEYEYPGKGYEFINDQFMLGKNIMVAPVVVKGARSREIVIPEGSWTGDDGKTVNGPAKITVDVPLSRLPWYRRVTV